MALTKLGEISDSADNLWGKAEKLWNGFWAILDFPLTLASKLVAIINGALPVIPMPEGVGLLLFLLCAVGWLNQTEKWGAGSIRKGLLGWGLWLYIFPYICGQAIWLLCNSGVIVGVGFFILTMVICFPSGWAKLKSISGQGWSGLRWSAKKGQTLAVSGVKGIRGAGGAMIRVLGDSPLALALNEGLEKIEAGTLNDDEAFEAKAKFLEETLISKDYLPAEKDAIHLIIWGSPKDKVKGFVQLNGIKHKPRTAEEKEFDRELDF